MSSRIVDPRREAEAFEAESRSDGRRAQRVKEDALARLASDLSKLSAKKLGQLRLDEELVDAVTGAQSITSAPAKNRQFRAIRVLLRDQDWVSIRTRLDALLETGVAPAPPSPSPSPSVSPSPSPSVSPPRSPPRADAGNQLDGNGAVLDGAGAGSWPPSHSDPVSDRTLGWTLRLIGEGAPGVEAFLAEFPRADRTHLRQLVRAVHKADGERRLRAERQLSAALRGFLK